MSSSYNTEQLLRELSEKLAGESQQLLEAAELLRILRENLERREEIEDLKERAKRWLK